MSSIRHVGSVIQGVDEKIPYGLVVTDWGKNPTNISVAAFQVSDGSTKTSTLFPTNTPSAAGNLIRLSLCEGVLAGIQYRVEIKFDVGGGTYEAYFLVTGE